MDIFKKFPQLKEDFMNSELGKITDDQIERFREIWLEQARKAFASKSAIINYMTQVPFLVREDESSSQVLDRMSREKIRHLPVVDRDENLKGVISSNDIRMLQQLDTKDDLKASDIMTSDPYSALETQDIKDVLKEMASRKIGSVIVTDDGGNISGIFTTLDAIELLEKLI